jgi:hypothetical protein
MKRYPIALALLLAVHPLAAAEPSDRSLEKLFELSEVKKLSEASVNQVNLMINSMVEEAVMRKKSTPERQNEYEKLLPGFSKKLQGIVKEEMSWQKMKAAYLKIYRQNLSQEEVDSLISFYQSATGKMFLKKMPVITQDSMRVTMELMEPISARIKESSSELEKALKTK